MTVSLIGKRFGSFDIQAKIGEGGMGMVYLGLHPQIGRRVAVKVLHEDLASKADVVSRFLTEARSVNDIKHPNIVDIVDSGETVIEGVTFKYIIMEFLDGEALSVRIRREGVSIRETLYIISQCASALAASHGKGVVHRDLKPENIYLCPRGTDRNYVKILDFGIAKLTGDGNAISQKTRTGMVIGTPAYMSPEQCEGKGLIDHRSDIYALGVVMYELLTGRVPFPGEGFGEVLVAHLTREPEPCSQLNPNIPLEIEAIVMRCLRKDKAQRFQSMVALGTALADPPAHYQQWAQSAQLPAGAMVASAGMGTIMLGDPGVPSPAAQPPLPQPVTPAPWNPAMSGLVQLPPELGGQFGMPQRMTGMMALPPSGSLPVMHGSSVNPAYLSSALPAIPQGFGSGQNNVVSNQGGQMPGQMANQMPGHGTAQNQAMSADLLVTGISQGPRPTTLSGASGQAGSGRRPRNVIIGFVGAMAVGVLGMVGYKASQGQGQGQGKFVPLAGTVTISVRSNPPRAEVLRGDVLEGAPGRTPYTFHVTKGAPAVDIKLRLDGYAEQTRTISTGKDQTVEVTLVKAGAIADGPAQTPKPPTPLRPPIDSPPKEQPRPPLHDTNAAVGDNQGHKQTPDSPPVQPEAPGQTDQTEKPGKKHHHHHGTKTNPGDGILQPTF